jgi:hypothetical protein
VTITVRLRAAGPSGLFLVKTPAERAIGGRRVQLVVTSPPFLDVVQYAQDNWLRFWFNGISAKRRRNGSRCTGGLTIGPTPWATFFRNCFGWSSPTGGWLLKWAKCVGVKFKLEEAVVPLGVAAGFRSRVF